MTKKQWEKIKNNETFDVEVLHQFFIENGGTKELSLEEFTKIFYNIDNKIITGSDGRPKHISHPSIMNKVRDYYDEKFERH